MRTSIRVSAALASLAASLSFGSAAQAAATANGTATAEILTTIAVSSARSLNFGQIAVNGAGTVAIAGNGTVTCSSLLVCTGSQSTAAFNVTGSAGQAYVTTVPTAAVTLSDGAGNTMTVDNFAAHFPAGNTLTGGASTFEVGGRLNVGATQAAGVYSGTFSVSVEYQ